MSPKLPVVSGQELIRALEKFGYVAVRQKGSHVRLRHSTDPQRLPVTVPLIRNSHSARFDEFSAMSASPLRN